MRTLAIVIALFISLVVPFELRADAPPESALAVLNYDKEGTLENPNELEAVRKRFKDAPPTHVFLMAHGWNNGGAEARTKYQRLLDQLAHVADHHKLRPADYRPLVIGLHWPSLAFERNEDVIAFLLKEIPAPARGILKLTLKRAYALDELHDILLGKKDGKTLGRVIGLARTVVGEDLLSWKGDEALSLKHLDARDMETLTDVIRVFSYWKMKQRAREVGMGGVRKLLAGLQADFPKAQFHLVGHSFGCKLWLSALAGEGIQPVDSLVLIQGAVSSQAFAEKVVIDKEEVSGGHRDLVTGRRVRGPVVATFTNRDVPVRYTYPLASRAAGHVAEVRGKRSWDEKNDAYRGMGSHGIEGGTVVAAREPGKEFGFKEGGLYSFDANDSKAITGHGEFYTPEVAWLIWAAALRR